MRPLPLYNISQVLHCGLYIQQHICVTHELSSETNWMSLVKLEDVRVTYGLNDQRCWIICLKKNSRGPASIPDNVQVIIWPCGIRQIVFLWSCKSTTHIFVYPLTQKRIRVKNHNQKMRITANVTRQCPLWREKKHVEYDTNYERSSYGFTDCPEVAF